MGYRFVWIAAICAAIVCAPIAGALEIGEQAPKFRFKDIRYLPRTLSDFGDKEAYVLVFTTGTCPMVRRNLPKLEQLHQEYKDKGVQFVAVNVAPDEEIRDVAYHPVEFNVSFPFVKDLDGSVIEALGPEHTPECVVLDKDMTLRYRGRVDDQYRLSGVKPEPSRADLKEAIDEVLAGEEVEVAETLVDGCEITMPQLPEPSKGELTYAKDIAPIINNNCVECHRPGQTAPFTLLNYDEVSGKARVIAQVVREQRMPPWFAHDDFGEFINERNLTPEEREKLIRWCIGDKAPGDLASAPEPPKFDSDKWVIGEPDIVITAKEPFELPATGYVDYQYVALPYQFPHDTWVQGIEIMPSNPEVVHHANLVYLDEAGKYDGANNFLTGKVPGGQPAIMMPGHAMFLPKGSSLMLQIHYVTTGKPETDQISVGLKYAEGTIHKRVRYKIVEDDEFAITPGAAMYESKAERTIEEDATIIALFSHMHLRGRDMTFVAEYPDGEEETLLVVPNYSFDWQLGYLYEPGVKKFPGGTKVKVTAHFDNSEFNPFNPDPEKEVKYGPQTYHEMMIGYMFYTVDDEDLQLAVNGETGAPMDQQTAQAGD